VNFRTSRFEGAYVEASTRAGGVRSVGRYVKGQKVGEWKYARGNQLISVDAGL
jgi:hypothetical protein